MRTDGQTDMTKVIVTFSNSANAPKKTLILIYVEQHLIFEMEPGHSPYLTSLYGL